VHNYADLAIAGLVPALPATIPEAAQPLGISPRSADRLWAYARAWLHQEITGAAPDDAAR